MTNAPTGLIVTLLLAGMLIFPEDARALFVNGDFEQGTLAPWGKTGDDNLGLIGPQGCNGPAFTGYLLGTAPGLQIMSTVVNATPPETGVDPNLGATVSLKYPKFGQFAARVGGYTQGGVLNRLTQQAFVDTDDIDLSDNRVHVRFVYAPVLQRSSGHDPCEQSFFYFRVSKVGVSPPLHEELIHAGKAGVPWQTAGFLYFTDWQLVDIPLDPAVVWVGDQVELEVVASGCFQSAHFGYLYLDAVGAVIPGLSVVKAPSASGVELGANLTYTFTYRNDGPDPVDNVVVTETIPDCATWVSHTNPSTGGACSYSSGTSEVVTCNVGTLAPGAIGTFTVTVMASTDIIACQEINNGNYTIKGDGIVPMLGPLVTTPIRVCVAPPLWMTAWWPLDEPTGNTAAELIALHDGHHKGSLPIPRITGLVGESLEFNGIDQYVEIPDPADGSLDFGPENGFGSRDFSIDTWIRPDPGATGNGGIVWKGHAIEYGFSLAVDRLGLLMRTGASASQLRQAFTGPIPGLLDGEWHHVAVTVDRNGGTTGGALVRFYVDGAEVHVQSLDPLVGSISNNGPFHIGAGLQSLGLMAGLFQGGIDEVEVFRTVLSPTTIHSIWFANSTGKCKHVCAVPSLTPMCLSQLSVTVPGQFYNATPVTDDYALQGAGLPSGFQFGGQTSTVQGPADSSFTYVPTGIQTIGPYTPFQISITMDRPTDFNQAGELAAYRITLWSVNSDPQKCYGFLIDTGAPCFGPGNGGDLKLAPVGVPTQATFTIPNDTPAPKSYDLEWSVQDSYGVSDTRVMSLGALPPGDRLMRTVVVPANGTLSETVTVTPLAHEGLRTFNVRLRVDLDGNGEFEPVTSAGFRTTVPPAELMPGRQISVAPAKLQILAKASAGTSFALPEASDDPRVEGGALEVFDTGGPGSQTYALPASGWIGLGTPAGSKGYRYRGTPADPCRMVLVKGRVVKALCKGPAISLPLPFVGDAGVMLAIGSDTKRYCATFGGTTVQNDAARLRKKDAPALDRCAAQSP